MFVLQEGEILKQHDLAETYRQIAMHGTDWFYNGPFASAVADWMAENGGIITEEDFSKYHVKIREPIESKFREYLIIGFPPPSSGGAHVAQILNILDHFDLKSIYQNDPALVIHIMGEAMKLAFADRAYWLGDADFADVPRGLIDRKYAKELAARIDLDKVIDVQEHGMPTNWESDVFGKHTTHLTAADNKGNWIAITATINTAFGSKVIVPGTGVILKQ